MCIYLYTKQTFSQKVQRIKLSIPSHSITWPGVHTSKTDIVLCPSNRPTHCLDTVALRICENWVRSDWLHLLYHYYHHCCCYCCCCPTTAAKKYTCVCVSLYHTAFTYFIHSVMVLCIMANHTAGRQWISEMFPTLIPSELLLLLLLLDPWWSVCIFAQVACVCVCVLMDLGGAAGWCELLSVMTTCTHTHTCGKSNTAADLSAWMCSL